MVAPSSNVSGQIFSNAKSGQSKSVQFSLDKTKGSNSKIETGEAKPGDSRPSQVFTGNEQDAYRQAYKYTVAIVTSAKPIVVRAIVKLQEEPKKLFGRTIDDGFRGYAVYIRHPSDFNNSIFKYAQDVDRFRAAKDDIRRSVKDNISSGKFPRLSTINFTPQMPK